MQMKEESKHQQGDAKEEAKQVRPCIAVLMTKIFKDIELFGPKDTQFSAAKRTRKSSRTEYGRSPQN